MSEKHTDFFKSSEKQAAIVTLAAWGENTEAVSSMLEKAEQLDMEQLKKAVFDTDNVELMKVLRENDWIGELNEEDMVEIACANAEGILKYLWAENGYDFSKNPDASIAPLIAANYTGNSNMFRLLLEYGASPSREVLEDICSVPDDPENLNWLIKYGADLENNGTEAMKNAIESCSLESIKTLHSYGVEITEQMYQDAVKKNIPSEHVLKYLKENADGS